MVSSSPRERVRFRSVFISDVHLGSPRARAGELLDFLERTQSEYLYLVGDIVDDGEGAGSERWPAAHREVLQAMQRKAAEGTHVHCLAGNHDGRCLEGWAPCVLSVERELEHTTADGRRLLIVHGDHFDGLVRRAPWLGRLGDALARALERSCALLERLLRRRHRRLGLGLKERIKRAMGYTRRFERSAVLAARARAADGIICGHVHSAASRTIDGLYYGNGGDWITSCTALVEHADGRLELVAWESRHRS